MSEWMTTGQVLDTLKDGEVAENSNGEKMYWELSVLIIESVNGNKYHHIKPEIMKIKWRILPDYVQFDEAMQALKEGKKAVMHYHNQTHNFHYGKRFHTFDHGAFSLSMLEQAKWTIEHD